MVDPVSERPTTRFDRIAERARVGIPGEVTSRARSFFRFFSPLIKLDHRPTLVGWDHLPTDRPYLLVANHSGGGLVELGCFVTLWLERFGEERKLTGMAHPVGFHLPGIAWFLRNLGAVPATYKAALSALEQGLPVLVFPGGDQEVMRPIWQAYRVDLAGRKGFLKIARRAWVPVVPLGIRGSHFTMPVLWRSRFLAWFYIVPRLVGGKHAPLTLLGAIGAVLILVLLGPQLGWVWAGLLAWLWLFCPLAHMPWVPWTVSFRVGAPIEPEDLFGDRDETRPLDEAYARVEAAVQEQVTPPTVTARRPAVEACS